MKLKTGDTVKWRGDFGSAPSKDAVVESIEITNGGKYGKIVNEVEWREVYDRNVVVNLTNDTWAYGDQISRKY